MTTPLQKARRARRLRQHELARRLGISQSYYSKIENGINGVCSPPLAERIARIFRRERLTELHVMYPRRREFRGYRPGR